MHRAGLQAWLWGGVGPLLRPDEIQQLVMQGSSEVGKRSHLQQKAEKCADYTLLDVTENCLGQGIKKLKSPPHK